MRFLSVLQALAIVLSCPLFALSAAHGDCDAPDFAVVWTYPEQGAENVPVNAQLWMLTSASAARGRFTLNGEPLEASFELNGAVLHPTLLPDTAYTLHFESNDSGEYAGNRYDLAFRTATAIAGEPDPVQLDGYTTSDSLESSGCYEAVAAQNCFDEGQNTFLGFQARSPGAVAWLVSPSRGTLNQGALLPASCTLPGVYTIAAQLAGECYVVRAVGEGGLVSEGEKICVEDEIFYAAESGSDTGTPADTRTDSDRVPDGCAAGPGNTRPSGQALSFGLVLLALSALRRSQQRRG